MHHIVGSIHPSRSSGPPRRCRAAWRVGLLPLTFAMLALSSGQGLAARDHAAALASVRHIVHRLVVAPPHARKSAGHVQQPLFAAYLLSTGQPDLAAITFVDKTVLDINRNTTLVLRTAKLTSVSRGEISVNDSPGSHHVITTADASATALGTLFDVRIETGQPSSAYGTAKFPAGTTTVSSVQGRVRVSNALGSVTVHAGQWTHVVPGRPPTPPTTHNAQRDVAWSSSLKP